MTHAKIQSKWNTKHCINYPYCTQLASNSTVAQSYSDYILDLQPALFGITAYMHNTRGTKEYFKIILLNLISSRPSTESSRYGAIDHCNMDNPLKMY